MLSFHVSRLFHAVKFSRLRLLLLCFHGQLYVVKAAVHCFFYNNVALLQYCQVIIRIST